MMRCLNVVGRTAATVIALLCALAVTPLRAQQPAAPAVQPAASAPAVGPRLPPEFARVEPAFPDTVRTTAATAAAADVTMTFTTVGLVLVLIIVVLLIAD